MHTLKVTASGYADGALTRQVGGGQTVTANVGLMPLGMPDTVPPDLDLAVPADGSASDVARIGVSGTATDATGGAVKLTLAHNGAAPVDVTVAQGMFAHEVVLVPGLNTFELTATDAAQNRTVLKSSARFRAGLEGEVVAPDLLATPIEGAAVSLFDASGAHLASTQSGTDGRYAFDLDVVPVHVTLVAEARGYQSLIQELDIGADARVTYSVVLALDPNAPMPSDERPHGTRVVGGCAAAPGLPLALFALLALRRRRTRS
jgi:hypothetical protein